MPKRTAIKKLFNTSLIETSKNGKHYSNYSEVIETKKAQKIYVDKIRDSLKNKKKFLTTPICTKGKNIALDYESLKEKREIEKHLGIKLPYKKENFIQEED